MPDKILSIIRQNKKNIIAAGIIFIMFVVFFIFLARSPVIIVADHSSIQIYGEKRVSRELKLTSLVLFRRVRNVPVADEAGNDIIRFAIADVSAKPYCVIFPLRFVRAARLFHEDNPQIPVVLLEGRYLKDDIISVIGGDPNDYFIYKTDIDAEFHKAGLIAAALDAGKDGKVVVFLDQYMQTQAVNAFLQAINTKKAPIDAVFFTSFSQFYEISDLSCAVLAGKGIEFLESNQESPVIFFTWIDPSVLPENVVMVVNDSPWAQAVQAVRMVGSRSANGQLKSKFQIINRKNIDSKTLRKLKK